jgi:hypothetical protein
MRCQLVRSNDFPVPASITPSLTVRGHVLNLRTRHTRLAALAETVADRWTLGWLSPLALFVTNGMGLSV